MKKHLLSLFAMACMVFASSCTSEEIVSQSTGNEVKVTFTTELRNDVKSRAVGDDTDGIDQLVFAVYDENKVLLEELTQTLDESDLQDAGAGKKKAEINVVLVKGQTYSFAFWAQDKDYSAYTFDPATKKVIIKYDKTANNKNADAFFANDKFTVTGSFKKDITLKRPFAQVNFLTTEYDLNKAKAAGFEPSQSSIIVKNAATSLDILTGEVEGDVVAEFALANLLSDESTTIKNASNQFISWSGTQFMTTDNESYACGFKYLATAYFLPTAATTTSTITTSMMAKSSVDSKAPIELTVSDINAQRNYRTNIYGNLLTNNGQFNVTIDPGFDGDYSEKSEDPTTIVVATVDEANDLFANGETNVTIQEAPTSPKTIYLPATNDNITINFDFEENTTPDDITIEYQAGTSQNPANIEVNGDAGDLIINTPESTVTLNGSYTNVESTTANNTLIVPKGVTIGTLTLKQGNAKIYYGAVETITNEGKVAITWLVDSKEQLAQIAADVNGGKTFLKEIVELISDIDLNNEEWTPIGTEEKSFQGTFDGHDHMISNLNITGNNRNVGLFGMTTNGEIKNLTVNNAKVAGRLNVGVVAGTPYTSKYTNIKVTGHVEVNGMAYVGTVGGKNAYANWDNITVEVDETSYVNANSVENGTAYRTYVGGVVGFNGEGGHSFKNITSNIDVKGSTCDVGGLFGIAHYGNKFENCVGTGDVEIYDATEAAEAEEMGGIAGVWNNTTGYTVTFTGCSFTGKLISNFTEGVDLTNNTIVGKAYSATGEGKLIIDGGNAVYTQQDLLTAIKNASKDLTIKLMNDITIDGNTTILIGKEVNIDLNGKTLSSTNTRTETHNDFILVKGILNVSNGTITYQHTGNNMGWNGCTNLFDITAGGVLNINNVTANNLGGTDMNFAVHMNNWGEVTLNAENCEFLATYCGVRVFNSGFDNNNVTIKNSKLTGSTRAFWVHNYIGDLDANQHSNDAIKNRLKFSILSQNNTFEISGTATSPIRYGMANPVYYVIEEDAIYVQSSDAVTYYGYYGDATEVTVPAEVNGVALTATGKSAFSYSNIQKVTLPNTLVTLGERTFEECSALTSIILGEKVTTIGDRAFKATKSLTTVELPNSVTTIVNDAFQKSGIKYITIPENVTYIGKTAFGACTNLETITINAKNITIANYCARACANLKSVYIYSDNVTFESGSMYFTNKENADASGITFYVKTQAIADALYQALSVSHSYGLKIVNIDGNTEFYNTLK